MTRRRPLLVGNWKMHGIGADLGQVAAIADTAARHPGVEVALCLPSTLIDRAARLRPDLAIGAQDCHAAPAGAFTGGISAAMVADAGASLVIVGHSERRSQGDDAAMVRDKLMSAQAAGLDVILCVGETANDHAAGRGAHAVAAEMVASLPPSCARERLIVAYEPRWAIGTGRTPTAAEVKAVVRRLRETLADSGHGSAAPRILYGGSVSPDNTARLLEAAPDGLLVGAASLAPAEFDRIITIAAAAG